MLQRADTRARLDRNVQSYWCGYAVPWAFGLALTSLVSAVGAAAAQPSSRETPIAFSIPAQPLRSALSRYGDVTGSEALYDASLAAGQVSDAVYGTLTPGEALERLLAGTGLSARFVAEGKFVLLPKPPTDHQAETPFVSPAHRRYYALIQEGLLDALCRYSGARPGSYRMIAVFSIAASGAIENARRIGSAGSAEADRQINAALGSVRFSEPPPPSFAQPVRILIVPQTRGVTPGCATADVRLGAIEGGR